MAPFRCSVVLAALGCVGTATLSACDEGAAATPERACRGSQAISMTNLYGTSLPPKTLALTFDDGPGARTDELSSYLKAQGIRAAFFVNGKMIGADKSVLQQIVADGHVVANHTHTHASLTGQATGGAPLSAAEIVAEVAQTDALIAPFVPANRFMFRPPYGDFDNATALALAASPMGKYVGPIFWEMGDLMGPGQAADWDCWQPGSDGFVLTPQQCGDLYVQQIESVGRGIVLMHDPYFVDDDPTKAGTVDMVEYLVPILKAKGFTFQGLDEVPQIAALLPALPLIDAGSDAGGDAGGTNASHHDGSSGDALPVAKDDAGTPSPAAHSPSPRPEVDPCAAR